MTRNVILLTLDTLRKDVVGCLGAEPTWTPFIDSLHEKCITFTKTQAIGPYTHASFPGILTSSYSLDYGDHGRADKLSPKRTLISETLKRAGIVTAAFHSNASMCAFFGWNRGWDVFYDSMEAQVTDEMPYIGGDRINSKVDGWLSTHVKSEDYRPFFLWTHYMDIHEPYIPEQRYLDTVDPSIRLGTAQMFKLFTDVLLKRDVSDAETVALLRKLYLAHVRQVDDYVREYFGILEKHGVLKDSVVIVTSDHGDEFNEHGGLSHDGKMYSELIDVPLFVYDGAGADPVRCDTLVSNIDIPPTVLHLFGLDPCDAFQGRSLLPIDAYPSQGCFGEAIAKRGKQLPDDRPTYYYREGDRKIIYSARDDRWEMYDLAADGVERVNIVDTAPDAAEFKSRLQPRIDRNTA